MLFNSVAFLLFFPIVCVMYYAIPVERLKARNYMLLAASYYFYMNWEPAYALLLLTSTVVTYLAARGMEGTEDKQGKKLYLVGCLVLNLAILFLFKYYNFLASNIETLLKTCGLGIDIPEFGLLLPVGISFYTFQALGYSIDVYRGTTKAERDFGTYALFVSFFPQLVAGPIERSNQLLPQFKQKHNRFDYEGAMAGIRMMMWGYFLKLVVADRCGIYVDTIFNNLENHHGGSYLMAALIFPFQIYGDFAGYSLIAIGVARVMGFRLMENFRRPYFASSIGEFWHRWHISLSTWFRDYVYIPLGGNRVSRLRQYFNLMVTFVVSGIWHGANWTFLCWGALHGGLCCIEKSLGIGKKEYSGLMRYVHWAVTFVLVCMAWVMFRSKSIGEALIIYKGIFARFDMMVFGGRELAIIAMNLMIVFIVETWHESGKHLNVKPQLQYWGRHFAIAILIAYITLLGVLDSSQFIYFQF